MTIFLQFSINLPHYSWVFFIFLKCHSCFWFSHYCSNLKTKKFVFIWHWIRFSNYLLETTLLISAVTCSSVWVPLKSQPLSDALSLRWYKKMYADRRTTVKVNQQLPRRIWHLPHFCSSPNQQALGFYQIFWKMVDQMPQWATKHNVNKRYMYIFDKL